MRFKFPAVKKTIAKMYAYAFVNFAVESLVQIFSPDVNITPASFIAEAVISSAAAPIVKAYNL
jgi:hypothetical protein